jgi:hypothetical protein
MLYKAHEAAKITGRKVNTNLINSFLIYLINRIIGYYK